MNSSSGLCFLCFTWRDDFVVSKVTDLIPSYLSVLYLFCYSSFSKHGKWSGVILKSYTSMQELEYTMGSMIILKRKFAINDSQLYGVQSS